ncbi:nucleotide-binding protein [Desulforhopalus singaporensis]|uniref:CobQ/CobB/MinD/ParA nucleotide binding domain-containing protein n=1 Tax=Desulforhopalus singaporensis TaxID=91360 RepID=A0A1H0PC68_9BACT|nr:P-loop NTPase [Desulforhopalus singaporensis]SDP02248.1 CobQ/CobB/MinD/ParA nucleotide binding domain-containing protein [Desulforhopalus singaporensis]
MATIHLILQGKGGVGKSFVSSLLAQYLIDREEKVACFDTDPVNATFSAYKSLQVHKLDILEDDNINSRLFDSLIEQLLQLPEDSSAVIDNGAASFIPLASYISENMVPDLLKESGHDLIIHTVITGGQSAGDTLKGLQSLLGGFNTPLVVWVNPFFGSSDYFTDHNLRQEVVQGGGKCIALPTYKKDTFGFDIETMLSRKLTFDEAIQTPEINLMARQRLKIVQQKIYQLLDEAQIVKEKDDATE